MNKRQWMGACVVAVGVIATGYAIHAMNLIKEAKGEINFATKPFSGNRMGRAVGERLEESASQYDNQVRLLLIGGIALILIGGGAIYYLRD